MTARTSPKTRTRAALAGWLLAPAAVLAQADSPACQRVAQASLVRLDSPGFLLVQQMPGMRQQSLKQDGKLYTRTDDEPWSAAPVPLSAARKAAQLTQKWLLRCSVDAAGESFEGEATDILRFEVKAPQGKTDSGRVWIGRNTGRPYREESGAVRGTTRYTGLPSVKL